MSPPPAGFVTMEFGAAALSIAVAGYLLRIGRGRPVNRNLAFILILEAGAALGIAALWIFDESPAAIALMLAAVVGLPWFYLRFLSVLDTPLTAGLRKTKVQTALMAAASLGWLLVATGVVILTVNPAAEEPWWYAVLFFFIPPIVLVPFFGLAASISAWRRTLPSTLERDRARAFALAFGIRDTLLAIFGVIILVGTTTGIWIDRLWPGSPMDIYPLATLLYVPFLAYGVVKTQLFDIDVRLRHGVRATLLSAFFLAVLATIWYVVEELVEIQFGWLFGLGIALTLTFGLRPVERAATRLAHRLVMPLDSDGVESRKQAVYRVAFGEVWRDGRVEASERARLTRLGADLGLEPRVMASIEEAFVVRHSSGTSASVATERKPLTEST